VQVESNTKKLAYFIAETLPIFDFVIKIVQVESNTKKLAYFIAEMPPIFDFFTAKIDILAIFAVLNIVKTDEFN